MTVSCTREHLLRGLQLVERALGKNATLPILEHVAIKTQAGKLSLAATDLEIAVIVTIPAKPEGEEAWTVPARVFAGLIASVPDGPVQIKKSGKTMTIKGKGFLGKINCGVVDEFPIIPEADEGAKHIKLNAKLFTGLIEQTVVATAVTESRPELNGVFVSAEGALLSVAATDTFRLALRVIPYEDPDEFTVILPARTAQEIIRLFKDAEILDVKIDENQITIEAQDVIFTSRLIEGSFPDYTAIIPKDKKASVTVDKQALMDALEAAGHFTSRLNDVHLSIKKGGEVLSVSAENADIGNYTKDVETQGEGEAEASFNIRYLIDGLRTLSGEKIDIEMNGEQKPTVLKPQGGEEQDLYLLMPIRTT